MRENRSVSLLCVACASISSHTALAQTGGIYVEVSNVVSPSQPTAIIDLYVYIDDPSSFAYYLNFDLFASKGEFGAIQYLHQAFPSGTVPDPVYSNSYITGITTGHLFPPKWGGASYPVKTMTVQWTTTQFEPREVDIYTKIETLASLLQFPNTSIMFIGSPTNGSATIQVIPAPASAAALLAAAGVVGVRKRRR